MATRVPPAGAGAPHPLDPLTASEVKEAARAALDGGFPKIQRPARVVEVELEEEPSEAKWWHEEMAGKMAGTRARAARVLTYEPRLNRTCITLVRLSVDTTPHVVWRRVPTGVQPAMDVQEYAAVEALIASDAAFQRALVRRGVPQADVVARTMVDPWCVGYFDESDGPSRRLCRPIVFVRGAPSPNDNGYATPCEGLEILVDIAAMRILELKDTYVQLPPEDASRNFKAFSLGTDMPRNVRALKPLHTTQPEGPSFRVDGHLVQWCGWSFRVGFTAREGLVLHNVMLRDPSTPAQETALPRPVVKRLSFVEMVVPYSDPGHFRKNAFDAGEDGLGRNANSLRLGCDCAGSIYYFDAVLPRGPEAGAMSSDDVDVRVIERAICLHEDDDGLGWKHVDWRSEATQSTRRRRLTVSFGCQVANYAYLFYVHFTSDGMVEADVKLTGILSVGVDRHNGKYGTVVAPGVVAPLHQHFFSARMHMAVDGDAMTVHCVDATPSPPPDPATNPHGNCFTLQETRMVPNSPSGTASLGASPRVFDIRSASRKNRMGRPTAFRLLPGRAIKPLAHQNATFLRRSAFLGKEIWLTRFHPEQRYPGGTFPNQSPRDSRAGLRWIEANGEGTAPPEDPTLDPSTAGLVEWCLGPETASASADDVVLWTVFGVTHIPRLEEWPVMPVETLRAFALVPAGFFDRNPTSRM